MSKYPSYPTKQAATAAAVAAGFTVHHDTSSSGDHGHGSREYWTRPNSPTNQHGWPLATATISQVGREWMLCLPEPDAAIIDIKTTGHDPARAALQKGAYAAATGLTPKFDFVISRDEARLAGRMTDAIVAVRDEFKAAGDDWKAERLDALLDLPTHSILTLAKAFKAVGA